MASKKKLEKNYRCHCGYNYDEKIRHSFGKLLSYKKMTHDDIEYPYCDRKGETYGSFISRS